MKTNIASHRSFLGHIFFEGNHQTAKEASKNSVVFSRLLPLRDFSHDVLVLRKCYLSMKGFPQNCCFRCSCGASCFENATVIHCIDHRLCELWSCHVRTCGQHVVSNISSRLEHLQIVKMFIPCAKTMQTQKIQVFWTSDYSVSFCFYCNFDTSTHLRL